MTRLPADGGERRPLVRRADGGQAGPLILELTERTVTIRPLRVRRRDAFVRVTWEGMYVRGLMAQIDEQKRAKRKRRAG